MRTNLIDALRKIEAEEENITMEISEVEAELNHACEERDTNCITEEEYNEAGWEAVDAINDKISNLFRNLDELHEVLDNLAAAKESLERAMDIY